MQHDTKKKLEKEGCDSLLELEVYLLFKGTKKNSKREMLLLHAIVHEMKVVVSNFKQMQIL